MNNTKKTPGQICYEAYGIFQLPWDKCTVHKQWESAAAAVLASQWRPVTEPPEDKTKPVIVWTLSRHIPGFRALEPGEEWHRNDFTEEMLPEGWRPLLLGEQSAHGIDEAMWSHKPDEFTVQELSCITEEENYNLFWRTTRHLPPTTQELERKEFEEWAFNAGYGCSATITRDTIFIGWQAARATAKPNP